MPHSSGVATGIDFGYFENVGKIKRRFFEYKNEANKSGIDMEDVIPDKPILCHVELERFTRDFDWKDFRTSLETGLRQLRRLTVCAGAHWFRRKKRFGAHSCHSCSIVLDMIQMKIRISWNILEYPH